MGYGGVAVQPVWLPLLPYHQPHAPPVAGSAEGYQQQYHTVVLSLQGFLFQVLHQAGAYHGNVDALSCHHGTNLELKGALYQQQLHSPTLSPNK